MKPTENLDRTIKLIFQQVFDVAPSEVHDHTSWETLERWDSLGHLALLEAIQNTFGIEIPVDQVLAMGSVADIKRIVSTLETDS